MADNPKTKLAIGWVSGVFIAACGLLTLLTPYEVDHEMTLLPWLMGKGWRLYGDLVDQHPPLLTWLAGPVSYTHLTLPTT